MPSVSPIDIDSGILANQPLSYIAVLSFFDQAYPVLDSLNAICSFPLTGLLRGFSSRRVLQKRDVYGCGRKMDVAHD